MEKSIDFMKKDVGVIIPKKCWVNERQKVCYGDEIEAEGEARCLEVRLGLKKDTVSVYKCELCGFWHLSRKKAQK